MNRTLLSIAICSIMFFSCSKSLNSGIEKGTAKWEVATFIQNMNSGKYDEALLQFSVNPVANGDISLDEFKVFADGNVTKNCTITSLTLTETPEEFDSNVIKVDIIINYADGSTHNCWVNAEKVDEVWKVTTRGSLF